MSKVDDGPAAFDTLSLGDDEVLRVGVRGRGQVNLTFRLVQDLPASAASGFATLQRLVELRALPVVDVRSGSVPESLPLSPTKLRPVLLHVLGRDGIDFHVWDLPVGSHVLSTSALMPRSLFDFMHREWEPVTRQGLEDAGIVWRAPVSEQTAWILVVPQVSDYLLSRTHAIFRVGHVEPPPRGELLHAAGFIVGCVGVFSVLFTFADTRPSACANLFRPDALEEEGRVIFVPRRYPKETPTEVLGGSRGDFRRLACEDLDDLAPIPEDDGFVFVSRTGSEVLTATDRPGSHRSDNGLLMPLRTPRTPWDRDGTPRHPAPSAEGLRAHNEWSLESSSVESSEHGMAGMGLALALNRAKSASKIRRTTAPETTSQELSMMPAETSGVDETLLDDVDYTLDDDGL
jgi:hypothetical protein